MSPNKCPSQSLLPSLPALRAWQAWATLEVVGKDKGLRGEMQAFPNNCFFKEGHIHLGLKKE